MSYDLDSLKAIPIRQVADRLALEFKGKNAKCFNSEAHSRGDKSPSLGLDLKTNRFKCFACDVKGSTIDLVMQAQKLDFKQACEWLANAFGISEFIGSSGDFGHYKKGNNTENQVIFNALISLSKPVS